MSHARIVLLTLLALIVSMVAGYFLVLLVVFGAWELMGVRDRDGGGAMAVGLVFAPAAAVVIGIIGAIVAARRLYARRQQWPSAGHATQDTRMLVRVLLAIAGLFFGWKAANVAQSLLYGPAHTSYLAGIALASVRFVLPIGLAVAGFILGGRFTRASPGDPPLPPPPAPPP